MASDSDSDSGLYSENWLRQQLSWPKEKKTVLESNRNKAAVNLSSSIIINDSNNSLIISSSDDDLEYEEDIKVMFVQESEDIRRLSILPSAYFTSIFENISKIKKISIELIEIIMIPGNRDVSKYDTLKSLNYSAFNIFHVYIKDSIQMLSLNNGSGSIKVTCITPTKINMVYRMESLQPLDILMRYCARDLHREISSIKLLFDGEIIRPTDTCSSLGLENQDLVEIHFI